MVVAFPPFRITAVRLKVIQLVLASMCLGLLMDAMMNGALPQKPTIGISCIVSGAYIIINVVLILTYALGQQLPCCVSTLFSAFGGLLFLMSGRAIISSWDDSVLYETELYALTAKRQVKSVGHLSILAGLMYLMDACYTALWESDEPEDDKPNEVASPALHRRSSTLLTPTLHRQISNISHPILQRQTSNLMNPILQRQSSDLTQLHYNAINICRTHQRSLYL